VRSVGLERLLFGWTEIEYRWAVLERHIPTWGSGLLIEMRSELARCAIKQWEHRRVVAALQRAGLSVIELRHVGWEAPHRVSPDLLGAHAKDVPSVVLR
jgi:hypothetical protein